MVQVHVYLIVAKNQGLTILCLTAYHHQNRTHGNYARGKSLKWPMIKFDDQLDNQ